MRLIKTPEHRPWPKFTTDMLVAEGDPKPVFVMPVLVQRDDEEVAWHSVHIRIGGLEGQQGAVYNSHTPAVAKEKADQLRTAADNARATGMVPFKVELNKTSRKTSLTPADARRVAQAIDEARRLLANLAGVHTKPGEPSPTHHRPTLLAALAGLRCFERRKENVAVEVLGHILSTSGATRAALSDLVVAGGARVGRIDRVETQVTGMRRAKPDLAGYDESGREHVLIEAKFTAGLAKHQPDTYLKWLLRRQKRQPSAVLFVAPAERREKLWKELYRVSKIELQPQHRKGMVRSAAVADSACWLMLTSWEALLDRMQAGVSGDSVVETYLGELRWLVDWQPPPPSR